MRRIGRTACTAPGVLRLFQCGLLRSRCHLREGMPCRCRALPIAALPEIMSVVVLDSWELMFERTRIGLQAQGGARAGPDRARDGPARGPDRPHLLGEEDAARRCALHSVLKARTSDRKLLVDRVDHNRVATWVVPKKKRNA